MVGRNLGRAQIYVTEMKNGDFSHVTEFCEECKAFCLELIFLENYTYLKGDFKFLLWDSEDFVNESLERVWKNLEKYDTERSFEAWYRTICRHLYYDYIRNLREEFIFCKDIDDLSDSLAGDMGAEDEYLRQNSDAIRKLYVGVDSLKENYRRAVELCYIRGFSVKKAASALDVNETTVNNWLKRGRDKLRAYIEAEGLEDELYMVLAA